MVAQEIDKSLLSKLEEMGFLEAQATKAFMSTGNSSIEAAVNWIFDHENDADIDEMTSVSVEIEIEVSSPPQVSEEVKLKAEELRDRARRKKEEEEKKLERQIEKERIRAGKDLLKSKRMAEETERKSYIAQLKAAKEEERRARERVHRKLQQDKVARSSRIELQNEGPRSAEHASSLVQERGKSVSYGSSALPVNSASLSELMRECLRSLKRRNKDRVGRFEEAIQFLELCGFEKVNDFLVLPRYKVDMALLKSAGAIIYSASTNPFFGLLSRNDMNGDWACCQIDMEVNNPIVKDIMSLFQHET